ncbi:MAG: Crp/Fnr family transcriptional regulator [Gammaproteobacteria bacterium]|nr:Crp/Fnr family transcriptional regulator [Gammaproteobacteria bacterium]
MVEQQLQYFFTHHMLFTALSDQEKKELLHVSRCMELTSDENLFYQGAQANHFYLLVSGKINLYRLSPDGLSKVIEVIHPGQAFAEALMFIEKHQYPVSAVAIESSKVIVIPGNAYKNILLQSPQSALKLMGSMAQKLHQRIREIENLTLQNTRHRLGNYLFGLVEDPAVLQAEFYLPMEKRLIASKLGMQPETFSRVFKEMRDRNILSVQGKQVTVHDMKALRSFGHEEGQ